MTLTPNFVKIGHLVQKMKGKATHKEHADLTSLHHSLRKENRLQMTNLEEKNM
jgi:hypothetical protein